MRRSLRLVLDGEKGVEVIAEADDLSTVRRHVQGDPPQVLVLDLGMQNGSSLETIHQLRRVIPGPGIVVVTMQESPFFAQQAINAGAVGFVLKDRADSELADAIRSAARGVEYVSPAVAAGVDLLRRAAAGDGLVPSEIGVLRLVALGHTSAEIARELHLSTRTVETHRARIYRKLGLNTRAELVSYALRSSLIGA
jgi:two-component system response regulator NreC